MSNIILQDLTAIINGTSKYNNNSDTVHVETLLVVDTPLTDMNWYVPAGVTVPTEVLELFKATNLEMYPMSESKVLEGTEDILQRAQEGDLQNVEVDAAKLMLRAIMKKSTLVPLPNTNNVYMLSYDYKLYPVKGSTNEFDFKVVLPFDGLQMVNGTSKVQMTVVMPIGAKTNQELTKGIDINGQELQELVKTMDIINKEIVSFEYHITDPLFTIRYTY